MKRGSFLCVIFAVVLGCMITPAQAARWTLVDFGTNETTSVTPYSDWTQILRHPNRTQFVQPDSNPAHDGAHCRLAGTVRI